MKRRHPFNEIRAMGNIIEGMSISNHEIERVAECQHGSHWRETGFFYGAENSPPIKNDQELIEILTTIDPSYNELRLARLRRHMQSNTIEKLEKGIPHKEVKRRRKVPILRQEYIKQLQESYKPQPIVNISFPMVREEWINNPKLFEATDENGNTVKFHEYILPRDKNEEFKVLFKSEREDG